MATAEAGKVREPFEPKLVTAFREGYSARQFLQDLFAGVTVGVVALPLAIAFAIARLSRPSAASTPRSSRAS